MSRTTGARRRTARERGAAAVELAIVLPLVLVLVGGIIDWGRFMFAQSVVTNAAREGARALSQGYVVGPATTAGTAKARVAGSTFGAQGTITETYAKVVSGTPTTLTLDTDKACDTASTLGSSGRVTITVTGFRWIILQPALRLLGGNISVQPNATAEAACTGT
jgi:Flp pilus assembly protein TadG